MDVLPTSLGPSKATSLPFVFRTVRSLKRRNPQSVSDVNSILDSLMWKARLLENTQLSVTRAVTIARSFSPERTHQTIRQEMCQGGEDAGVQGLADVGLDPLAKPVWLRVTATSSAVSYPELGFSHLDLIPPTIPDA